MFHGSSGSVNYKTKMGVALQIWAETGVVMEK